MLRASLVTTALLTGIGTIPRAGDPPAAAESFHFAHDILPLLQRAGCAAADCHGGATGRGGFKLSLFGSDPRADHAAITVDHGGRRIDLLRPEQSLLIRKPTRDLEHGGGLRLTRNGAAHDTITAWIRAGAPFTGAAPPRLDSLRLEHDGEHVRSVATFTASTSAGDVTTERDVTDRTTFSSTDERVVEVDASGILSRRPGSAWVLARYAHLSASVRILTPYRGADTRHAVADTVGSVAPSAGDRAWRTGLAELGLAPAPPAATHVLARRLYVDLVGRIPTPAELERFEDLPLANRVAQTARALCDTEDFADVFGAHLARWFEIEPAHEEAPRHRQRNARMRAELRAALRDGRSFVELADGLLARAHPILQRHADPRDRAEFVGRAFLGIRIGCARCHDHPLDRWRRGEHLAFSALFMDPRPAPAGGMIAGTLFDPESGQVVEPRLLPLTDAEPPPQMRDAPVRWFVGHGARSQVARNVVNRVFALLVGRGLVEPVDDHRPSNPPVHGALLDALTDAFIAGGHDLRRLVETIVTSEVYALTSEPSRAVAGAAAATAARTNAEEPTDRTLTEHLARRTARPLDEASFHRSLARTLGVELSPAAAPSASPLAGTLHTLNSDLIPRALGGGGTTVDAIADFVEDPERRLDELFALVLSRRPTDAERARLAPLLESNRGTRRACRDLAYALFCSREFSSIR